MVEYQLSEKGIFLLHGAAVHNNETNDSILIFGEKGMGKTSLVLDLCKKYNYSLVANDQVLIQLQNDEIHVLDGTKIFL